MNQENKFEEIKEKLLRYWAVVAAACGRFLEYVKVNGKVLFENLAVWAAGAWEKLRTLFGQAADWFRTTIARLSAGKDTPAEAVPEGSQALPGAVQESRETAQETDSETAILTELPDEEEIAPEPVTEVPQTEAAREEASWLRKAAVVFGAAGTGARFVLKWAWKLRKLFMAAPVIWAAVKLALENLDRLPEQVGLDIQSTGEFARMITREEAVWWPFGITMFCLLMMFCSKKPILPWVISIFTLVLPWLIWILNYYA